MKGVLRGFDQLFPSCSAFRSIFPSRMMFDLIILRIQYKFSQVSSVFFLQKSKGASFSPLSFSFSE